MNIESSARGNSPVGGPRILHLIGLAARDAEGCLVDAGDLAEQTEQAVLHLARQLMELGSSLDQVSHLKVYVREWSAQIREAFRQGMGEASSVLGVELSWPTLVMQVADLCEHGSLIELEAVALVRR